MQKSSNEFRCISGACIGAFSVCDGSKDCQDGSDETEAICKSLNIICPPSAFRCNYGACIDDNKKCNGQVDCSDRSDETSPVCPGTPITASAPLNCKIDEFQCKSGQCINAFFVCDGTVNCTDGSDETAAQCSNFHCPQFLFRCSYGGCIKLSARCNGRKDCADNSDEDPDACLGTAKTPQISVVTPAPLTTAPSTPTVSLGACLLPPPSEFASYTVPACQFNNRTVCNIFPGKSVPENWSLLFKCNDGYYMNESEGVFHAFCVRGTWSPYIPVCRKMCPPLVSLSVHVQCLYRGDYTDCSKPMRPGTLAKGSCKPSYFEMQRPPYKEIFCRQNGQWSNALFFCEPVCGKRNVKGVVTPTILHGLTAKLGEFPWHTGLYVKANDTWKQICGGSLISPHIVLTAAHCVFSEVLKQFISPAEIKVGLGKYYREWTHDEPGAVRSDVRAILTPYKYSGQLTSYAEDIALLDLKYSVQIHTNIMPVCVDWNREFVITPGMLGTVPGWGLTENKTSSGVLLYTELPYVDFHHCISHVPKGFQRYVTPDKFCAGYPNGTGTAKGDSGGGLTFVHNDLYYVHGVASTTVKNHTIQTFATYTNISNAELFEWFIYAKRKLDEMHLET